MIKKAKLITLLVILLYSMSFGVTTSTTAVSLDQATTVKLGLLTPKTGALGFLGQSFEDGATLAVQDLNGMQDDFTFQLLVEDTETDETATGVGMTNFVTQGVSAVVGAAASSNSVAAAAIAKANNIPMISYASTSPTITDLNDGDFLFRVVPSDSYQGIALAELVTGDIPNANVTVITLNDAYGQGLTLSFQTALENLNGSVLATFSYPSTQDDFTSIVNSVDAINPDAIVMVSFNTDGAAILDDIATQGLIQPVFGTDGTKSADIFTAVSTPANYEGVKGTAPLTENNTVFFNDFLGNFTYGPTIFVPEAYDATMILGKAVMAADSAVSCEVADEIRGIATEYDGVSGTITFDANGDQVSASYEYWEAVTGSAFNQIGTFVGDATAGTGDIPDTHCPVNPDTETVITTVISGTTIVSTIGGETVVSTETVPWINFLTIFTFTMITAIVFIRRRR